MNAQDVTATADALRRMLVLRQTGQMSEAAGCRIEGALAALKSISGDPSTRHARERTAESIRRLAAITEAGGMTAATACRIEGALVALHSIAGDSASLLAQLSPAKRAPAKGQTLSFLGQPPPMHVQL